MAKVDIKTAKDLNFEGNEAYRTLRSNILLYNRDVKAIVVTSTTPEEGKTSVAFNLARSMAKIGGRTIFVDGDLRKSTFLDQYGVEGRVNGFHSFLSGEKALEEVVFTSNLDNLDMIFSNSSSPNATELLESTYFKDLIPSLKEEYDYIIIDTPALGGVIDGAIIAQECDGAILVIEENAVRRKLARKAMILLEETDCKVLGVVINKIQVFKGNDDYTRYYSQ